MTPKLKKSFLGILSLKMVLSYLVMFKMTKKCSHRNKCFQFRDIIFKNVRIAQFCPYLLKFIEIFPNRGFWGSKKLRFFRRNFWAKKITFLLFFWKSSCLFVLISVLNTIKIIFGKMVKSAVVLETILTKMFQIFLSTPYFWIFFEKNSTKIGKNIRSNSL